MDYKQMFDAEELEVVLNAYYEAGVDDDIFALINEANESNTLAVKTQNGLTKISSIKNKKMQGDHPWLQSSQSDQVLTL